MDSPVSEAQRELRAIQREGGVAKRWARESLEQFEDENFQRQLGLCRENPMATWREDDLKAYDNFRVYVPCSGGLDSTTALGMALNAGLPVTAVYVDTGVEYADQEIRTFFALCDYLNVDPHVMKVEVDYQKWDYVVRGRNAIVIWSAAEEMRRNGHWGEIWFGNVGDVEETPIIGGDKTHRFFASLQHLLTVGGFDVRLCTPLNAMSKADLVRWWMTHGDPGACVPKMTWSCYGSGAVPCGACRACFRRGMAFIMAKAGRPPFEPDWVAFHLHAEKLRQAFAVRDPHDIGLHPMRVNPWLKEFEEMEI